MSEASPPAAAAEHRVLVLRPDPAPVLDALRDRFPEVRFEGCGDPERAEALAAELRPQVVFAWRAQRLPGELQRRVLARPGIEWVQVAGAGVDHLSPLPEGPVYSNVSGLFADEMAETVTGAVALLNFGFHRYFHDQLLHRWRPRTWTPLAGKSLLVLGLGAIGRRVAARARVLGMRVIGVRSRPSPVEGVDEVHRVERLHELLPRADFVTLHVPLTPATRGLVGREELARMGRHAYLLNAARGPVVETFALIEALRGREIAGAYLDVFDDEPLPVESPLWDLSNVVISPHVADSVAGWEDRITEHFAENLARWLAGETPANVIDPTLEYAS